MERGDGSQWLSSSRTKTDLDALPGQAISSEDGAQTIPNEKSSVEADTSMNELGSANSNLRSTRGQPRNILPPADSDKTSTNTISKVKVVQKTGGNHKKASKAALTLQPWAEGDGGRVPVWDSRSQRILWGNCAPLAKNIGKYLENHPTMKIWAGEGRQRFAVDEKTAERPVLDSTSVEFQAREFLGSDDGEDSSNSIPPSPIRGAQTGDSCVQSCDNGAALRTEEPDSDVRQESGIFKPIAEASTVVSCDCDHVPMRNDLAEGIAVQMQDSSIKITDSSISESEVPLLPAAVSLAESQVIVPIAAESACVLESLTSLTIANGGESQPESSPPAFVLSSAPLESLDTSDCLNTELAQKTPAVPESVRNANNSFPNLCVPASGPDESLVEQRVMVPKSVESQVSIQESASGCSDEKVQGDESTGTVSQVDPFALSNVEYIEGPFASTLQVPAEDASSI